MVLADKKIIEIAKRNMQGVNSLYYPMKKAKKELITDGALYKGLELAFTGGRIGGISNNITKIWASDDINEDAKSCVKWLCMETNFTIDYAKTLFKPTRPKEVNKLISSYTRKKVPYFFKFAKSQQYGGGDDSSPTEEIGNGVMDRITRAIHSNRLMFSSIKKLEKVDYRKLLKSDWEDYTNPELDREFNRINRIYGQNTKYSNNDKSNNNVDFILQEIRNDLKAIEPDESKLITSLAIHLYGHESSLKKNLFWLLYGKQLYENLKENCKDLGNVCLQCGRRVDYKLYGHKCRACRNEENRNGFKTITCCDCGKEFVVSTLSRAVRCDECREKHRNNYQKELMREIRNSAE